jgi:hypothetical protein
MEILVCRCNYGFTISERQRTLFPEVPQNLINRADERLIQSFKDGDCRGDGGSTLDIANIPDGAHYRIIADQGIETVLWSMSEINEA